jgi:hypothetical protein
MSRLVERYRARSGVPYVKTSVAILGRDQIDAFHAMCLAEGRQPHQLAADIVLAAIKEQQTDPALRALVASLRRARSGLRVVDDKPEGA